MSVYLAVLIEQKLVLLVVARTAFVFYALGN